MTGAERRAWVDKVADDCEIELLTADGFDDAILGVAVQFNHTFVVYDRAKVLAMLQAQGMTLFEALEYFEFNIAGGWHGKATPAYIELVHVPDC